VPASSEGHSFQAKALGLERSSCTNHACCDRSCVHLTSPAGPGIHPWRRTECNERRLSPIYAV
jgi:hypothetical protein